MNEAVFWRIVRPRRVFDMTRLLTAIFLFTFAAEPCQAQKLSGEEFIAKALQKTERDDRLLKEWVVFDIDRQVFEVSGSGMVSGPTINEPEAGQISISIDKFFKPGRYRYTSAVPGQWRSRLTYVIGFSPRENDQQLAIPSGSSEMERAVNRVLNELHGIIRLDLNTGAILHFEAKLKEPVSYRKIAAIYELSITYQPSTTIKDGQELHFPYRTLIRIRYNKFRVLPLLEKKRLIVYTIFLQPKPPSN